jgi:hypothetical protein
MSGKVAFGILISLLAEHAHAYSLDFRVHSFGGGEIVLCDAGIRHTEPSGWVRSENAYDTVLANLRRWDQSSNKWKVESEKQKVESWNGGSFLDENGKRIPRTIASTLSEDHLPHVAAKLQTKIDGLNLRFDSPEYGNEFFVDICYHGSGLTVWNRDDIPMDFNYTLRSWITATDLASPVGNSAEHSYLALAKPQVTASIACDFQGMGAYKDAPLAPYRFFSDLTERPVESEGALNLLMYSEEALAAGATIPSPFSFERYTHTPLRFSVPLLDVWGAPGAVGPITTQAGEWFFNTPQRGKAARYCVARYTFKELPSVNSAAPRTRSMQTGDMLFEVFFEFKQSSWYR